MKYDMNKIPVIILAAGESKRMGMPKGLLNFKGKPFLTYQIEQLSDMGFTKIIAVFGKNEDIYKEKIPELNGITVIVNPTPEKGQFSSIQCGLLSLSNVSQSATFILPVDVPCPNFDVWEKLAVELILTDAYASIPEFQGKKGHPVLISEKFKQHLMTSDSDNRLDFEIHKLIDQQKAKIISVTDRKVTLNINTPEEWNEFKVM